jgi:hypothetical protein
VSSNSSANFIGGKLPDFDLEVCPSFLDLGYMFLVKLNKDATPYLLGLELDKFQA